MCVCKRACRCVCVNGLSRVGICIKVIAMEIGERVYEHDRVRKLERDGRWRKTNREPQGYDKKEESDEQTFLERKICQRKKKNC